MANVLWLLPSLLPVSLLVLVRMKLREEGFAAHWPWWAVLTPLWVPLLGITCFGVTWLALALILAVLTGFPL